MPSQTQGGAGKALGMPQLSGQGSRLLEGLAGLGAITGLIMGLAQRQ